MCVCVCVCVCQRSASCGLVSVFCDWVGACEVDIALSGSRLAEHTAYKLGLRGYEEVALYMSSTSRRSQSMLFTTGHWSLDEHLLCL